MAPAAPQPRADQVDLAAELGCDVTFTVSGSVMIGSLKQLDNFDLSRHDWLLRFALRPDPRQRLEIARRAADSQSLSISRQHGGILAQLTAPAPTAPATRRRLGWGRTARGCAAMAQTALVRRTRERTPRVRSRRWATARGLLFAGR
jgi:hypothetical protein